MNTWRRFQAHCAWKQVHPCRELYEWALAVVTFGGMIYVAGYVYVAFMDLPSYPAHQTCVMTTHGNVVCGDSTQ